jgi:hypothetical protein
MASTLLEIRGGGRGGGEIMKARTAAELTIGNSSTCSNETCIEKIPICNYDDQIHHKAPHNHAGLQMNKSKKNEGSAEELGQ